MTVKMSDGNFYNGVTLEITLDISDSSNLDTGTEAASTWYYVYAVALLLLPLNSQPRYLLQAMEIHLVRHHLNILVPSITMHLVIFLASLKSVKMNFVLMDRRSPFSGIKAKTDLELKYVPKTSISVALSITIRNGNSGGNVHLDIYALGSTKKFGTTGAYIWGRDNIGLNASTPKTIEYQTSASDSSGVYGYKIETVGYIDNRILLDFSPSHSKV